MKTTIYILFILLFFLECVILHFIKFPNIKNFYGLYQCANIECTIKSSIPIDSISYFKENSEIEVNKKRIKIIKVLFLEISNQNNQAYQTIAITIPKQEYFNHQTIPYAIKTDYEGMWSLLWKAMKGGDES